MAGEETSEDLRIEVGLEADLDPTVRLELERIYLASYDQGDVDWFRKRLGRLTAVAVGWIGDDVIGFGAQGIRTLDLGPIGSQQVLDAGFTCVDPERRVSGAGSRVGPAPVDWLVEHTNTPPPAIDAMTIANPVMLHIARRYRPGVWPTGTLAEIVDTLLAPTSTQKTVGGIVAAALGASSYDADHWVMHHDANHGAPRNTRIDIDPVTQPLFRRVDFAAGDRLLHLSWNEQPPAIWFD